MADIWPSPVGVVNLASPVRVGNLASPVGVVNLASPVGVVVLASPVGVVVLAPPVGVVDLASPVGGSGSTGQLVQQIWTPPVYVMVLADLNLKQRVCIQAQSFSNRHGNHGGHHQFAVEANTPHDLSPTFHRNSCA